MLQEVFVDRKLIMLDIDALASGVVFIARLSINTSRDEQVMNEDRMQGYRQPMVTATGIILGFVLNFASSWVKNDNTLPETFAYFVFALSIVGVACLVLVLSRVLQPGIGPDRQERHYSRTRVLFVVGVTCAVAGALVDMLGNFFGA